MTSTELALFKDMIKECVREVLKEELGSSLVKENKEVKKDLHLIKKLIAKNIQESRKSFSSVKPNRNILAEQARKVAEEQVDISEEQDNNRPFEDTLEGLYRIWGGKEDFERSTRGSTPLSATSTTTPTSVPPVVSMGKNPINDILNETKRTMTDEDRGYVGDGIREAIRSVPPTPPPSQREAENENYNTKSLPDFDPADLLKKKHK